MADEVSFQVEPVNLREVLDRLNEIDPKLTTNLRREFRAAGSEILGEQRAALSKRPPRVGGSKKRLRLITPKGGRKPYFAFRTEYDPGDVRQGGVSQLRAKIAAGLRVSIRAGKHRQAIEFRSNGPRNGGANMARVFESRMFRHPVFGAPGQWAPQYGSPYFHKPVTDQMRSRMADRINEAISNALSTP